MVASPDDQHVYIAGDQSHDDVLAVDTTAHTVTTIPVGQVPNGLTLYGMKLNADGTRLYVANAGDGTLSVIDTATNTVTTTLLLTNKFGDAGATGTPAFGPDGRTLYVPGEDFISVVDTTTNTVSATIDTPDLPGIDAFSPDGSSMLITTDYPFAPEGAGYIPALTVVDLNANKVVDFSPDVLPTDGFITPDQIVFSDGTWSVDGRRVYATDGNEVFTTDSATLTAVGDPTSIPNGYRGAEQTTMLSPDGTRLYVLQNPGVENRYFGYLTVIDTATSNDFTSPSDLPLAQTPSNTAGLYEYLRKTADSGDQISFQKVENDGTERLIVYIGGTNLDGGHQALLKNILGAAGAVDSFQTGKINDELAADPSIHDILLVGYSQGGMDAQNIALSGDYDVTGVVTFGSPIITYPADSTDIVHIQIPDDPIVLTTNNAVIWDYNNAHGKVFDAPAIPFDPTNPLGIHADPNNYIEAARLFDASDNPAYDGIKARLLTFQGDLIDD
jgi:YVTN family beta-propeller protein